jgi:hypothetical protein
MSVRSVRRTCAAVLLLLLVVGPSRAQDVTEPALKAAFIYGFVKFTLWPDDAWTAAAPSVMCVLGDDAIADALDQTVRGRLHAGHRITVSRVTANDPLRGCHVLYLSHVGAAQAAQIVRGLRGAAVLTVSDLDRFGDLGGIAQLYFEHGQLHFTLRTEPAVLGRLEISSKLLSLSKRP